MKSEASSRHLNLFLELNRAHAVVSRRFDAHVGGLHGIGLNDLHLLYALDQAPGRRLRRIDLAGKLGVTPSGVTWILRPLIKRRLVASESSETDARVAFAVLTEGGHRLLADALLSAQRLAKEALEAVGGAAELARVAELLGNLGG
jgi:DNA-binding MarR family transcriptional regulator